MKKIDLYANKRETSGNRQPKKLRREMMIPGIVYSKDSNNLLIKVNEKEINSFIAKNGEHVIVQLKIDGIEIPAIIKEMQRDPVNRRITHLDFQPVSLHEIIHAEVPIVLINGERAEKNGWVINRQITGVEVAGEVEKIPENITVDVAKFKMGDVFKVGDIEISREISIVSDKNDVVFSIKHFKEEPIDLVFDRTEPELIKNEE